MFVLIGLIEFIWALERKNNLLAGLCAILIAGKPHIVYAFWILLLCFCIRNRKIRLFSSVAACIAIPTLILFLYNPHILSGMVKVVLDQNQFIWITATPGISLRMIFGLDRIWLQVLPTVLGALYVIIFWNYREPFSWRRNLPPILLLSTATATYLWPYDCAILLPVIIQILVWFHDKPHSRRWMLALLVCANILIPLIPPWRNIYLAWWCPASIALIYIIMLHVDNRPRTLSDAECVSGHYRLKWSNAVTAACTFSRAQGRAKSLQQKTGTQLRVVTNCLDLSQ